jgi:antitoxin MazE
MKARIIRIGNSRGIRIPKPLLEQAGLEGEVEITAREGSLVIRPAVRPRAGWAEAFAAMARRGDDALLDEAPPSLSAWDEDEWEWQ